MYRALFIFLVIAGLVWKFGPRRGNEPGFKYVHVNQDGSVRELSPDERDYLSQDFSPGDSARPYFKLSYGGSPFWKWGSQSGFIERRRIPRRLTILPINPDYDELIKDLEYDYFGADRAAGDLFETQEDGSICITPNPNISQKERLKLMRKYELAEERSREALAKIEIDG